MFRAFGILRPTSSYYPSTLLHLAVDRLERSAWKNSFLDPAVFLAVGFGLPCWVDEGWVDRLCQPEEPGDRDRERRIETTSDASRRERTVDCGTQRSWECRGNDRILSTARFPTLDAVSLVYRANGRERGIAAEMTMVDT